MPRIKRDLKEEKKPHHPGLVKKLVDELKSDKEYGQPRIEETPFPNGAIRVTVIWDAWERVPPHERADVILEAYERAEGKSYCDRIVVAVGLTYPEAHELGMLPYKLEYSVREGETPSEEQCLEAMLEEGASRLFRREKPELRFATQQELEKGKARLQDRLPGQKDIWVITKEMSLKDV